MKRTAFWVGLLILLQIGVLRAQSNPATIEKVSPMASDADPSFEVATIKPTNPDHPLNPSPLGHRIVFPGTTVRFLMAFIYDVHDKQIIGAPDWVAIDKFDFEGVANAPGTPNLQQIQVMFQKLFAERLQLRFHHEKREMSTYLLTVAKGGPLLGLSPTDSTGYHTFLGIPQRGMQGHNLSMTDFASRLQSGILDRPVVDQTNLKGTYDFLLKWTPDESQFNQVGARMPTPSDAADAPPNLFTAISEQLGLKLIPAKASVDVLVINHIARPSEN